MDLKQYARLLRAHWVLILGTMVACNAAAAVLAWTREPVYTAQTQLFVSTAGPRSDSSPSETYQGGLFSQARVTSYANVVSSPSVVQAVIKQLGIDRSVQDVQSKLSASVPEGTVLIDVTVTDRSPQMAKAIADAVGDQFPRFVEALESAEPGQASPIKLSVTSPARLPTTPTAPHKSLYVTLGVLFGFLLGTGLAVLREMVDSRIRRDEDAVAVTEAPILGRISHDQRARQRPLVVAGDPDSAEAEAFRRLRTNLRVVSLDRGLQSIVVSSAVSAEGKTLIVANLGFAFAQAGTSVVLVDADMRRSGLASVLGLEATVGLSDVLAGDVPLENALRRHRALPLEVLASCATPPNPSELLGSDRCVALHDALTRRAEIVLFDTPALLPVSDAAVLSRIAAAVVLVARVPSTRVSQLDVAAQSLHSVGRRPLGVVLNDLSTPEGWPYDEAPRLETHEFIPEASVWDG
jgi:succinoglycan biosynthesis transport protein ExoP